MSDSPSRAPRCTAAQKRHRVLLLQRAISDGEAPAAAARRLCRSWGLAPRRSVRRYLAAAFASWSRDRKLSHAASLDTAVARRLRLYTLAVAGGDFGAAARVLDGLDELAGIRDGLNGAAIEKAMRPTISTIITAVRTELPDAETVGRVVARIMSALHETEPATNGSTYPRNRAGPFLD